MIMTEATAKTYHWTPAAQRCFLETLAETGSVAQASLAAGKSRVAAYNLRFRRDGSVFRMGWDAAVLIARACLADDLHDRAFSGQDYVTIREADGTQVTRRLHDNRLGLSLLARLDRMATDMALRDGDTVIARLVSSAFEDMLDVVSDGADPAAMAQLLAELMGTVPQPANPGSHCKLDDEIGGEAYLKRQAEMEEREANATMQGDPTVCAARMSVWYCDHDNDWRTDFPPPPGFDGEAHGQFGDGDYHRALSGEERAIQDAVNNKHVAPLRAAGLLCWAAYFGLPVPPQEGEYDAAPALLGCDAGVGEVMAAGSSMMTSSVFE
jgi:hypothetical protein